MPDRPGSTTAPRVDVHLRDADLREALELDVRTGLQAEQNHLPPVWFYDDRGSALFDQITHLPEYYLTRAERRLLESHSNEIAASSQAEVLVELGAGTCDKSRILLDALSNAGTLKTYAPLDVSDQTLLAAATALAKDYPALEVHAMVGDFSLHIDRMPANGRRLIVFLTSTIGNLSPTQRSRFLFDLDCTMTHTDSLLLDADFDPSQFDHVALWNDDESQIEMRLCSVQDQYVQIKYIDLEVHFSRGEDLLTETSAKFTRETLEQKLSTAGLVINMMWEDPEGFLLTHATPYC